jgi:hypothetical protein
VDLHLPQRSFVSSKDCFSRENVKTGTPHFFHGKIDGKSFPVFEDFPDEKPVHGFRSFDPFPMFFYSWDVERHQNSPKKNDPKWL